MMSIMGTFYSFIDYLQVALQTMGKIVRKQIDLTKETIKGLKILAALQDTNPKKYIENLLTVHVKTNVAKVMK